MIRPVLLISLLALISCGNKPTARYQENANIAGRKAGLPDSVSATDTEFYDFSKTELTQSFYDTVYHLFSDSGAADRFTFCVPAGNINQTLALLRVENNKRELVFTDSFRTADLVSGYDLYRIHNDAQMVAYILERAKAVLDTASFFRTENGIPGAEDPAFENKGDFEDYATYLECRREKRPLFELSLHEEDNCFYGYSASRKKTVLVIARD